MSIPSAEISARRDERPSARAKADTKHHVATFRREMPYRLAAVLTYVRNSFGNRASPIQPDQVKKVREEIKDKVGLYTPEELLKEHPME